jgi:hypothetical protein
LVKRLIGLAATSAKNLDGLLAASRESYRLDERAVGVSRLADAIPEELWNSKSAALQDELRQVRTEMERHGVASQAYETAGLQILELAQTAYSSYVAKNPHEQARLIKTLVTN